MKKVIFNASSIANAGNLTGIGLYTLALAQALEEYFKSRGDVELNFYAHGKLYANLKDLPSDPLPSSTGFIKIIKKALRFFLIGPLYFYLSLGFRFLAELCFKRRHHNVSDTVSDLYIQPEFLGPKGIRSSKILGCIHDMPIGEMWCLPKKMRLDFEKNVFPQMSTYTEVICFSQCTKADIINALGFTESKVHVIYHGLREYRDTHHVSLPPNLGEFILVVGAKSKRKNATRLIEAFQRLPQNLQKRFKIVLTSSSFSTLTKDDEKVFKQDFIVNLGYVSDALLQTLYKNARLLWWGSLAEGFGLPMVEAMQAQCVVLASNVSCMPEILGDAGIYCDPYSVQDITRQLEVALTDEVLRKECIERGLKRAKEFDLKKSMQKHIEIVERMLEES
ncbi:glycosyltransferase family 4 protein [Helicobacter felis]|uniref:glycosyltransferase family 4 protein n=1 Tax=Helicobacter felis TaxID=214 RepID=UPI000CF05C5E|nr:glycosyltransferase family 1 protein [Helicobacter felis]